MFHERARGLVISRCWVALIITATTTVIPVTEAQRCVAVDYTVSSGLCAGLRLKGNKCLIEYYGMNSQQFGDYIVSSAEDSRDYETCSEYSKSLCLNAPVKNDYCQLSTTAGVCQRMQKFFFGSVECDNDSDCDKNLREYSPIGDGYNRLTPNLPCCQDLWNLYAGFWCQASKNQATQAQQILKDQGRCYDETGRPTCKSSSSRLQVPLLFSALVTLSSLLASSVIFF